MVSEVEMLPPVDENTTAEGVIKSRHPPCVLEYPVGTVIVVTVAVSASVNKADVGAIVAVVAEIVLKVI